VACRRAICAAGWPGSCLTSFGDNSSPHDCAVAFNAAADAPDGTALMPLYSFHCKKCDSDVELLVDADATPTCSRCGGRRLTRLMSRVAAPGKSRSYAKTMRTQASREGHTSNFSRSERGR